jgi:hypothetical protein
MPPKKANPPPGFVATAEAAVTALNAPNERASGAAVVPDLGAATRVTPFTRVEASVAFMLKAHPNRWTVLGGQVIPLFGRLVLQPGINGVQRIGTRINASEAKATAEDRGWKLIPFDAVPPHHVAPGQQASYLYCPEGRPDATLLLYQRCYPGSERSDCDEVRFLEFCAHLETTDVIKPPALWVLEQLAEKLHREADALADKAREHTSYKTSAARAAAACVVVDKLIESRRTAAVPSMSASVEVDL